MKKMGAAGTLAAITAGNAYAALPAEVTTAITDAGTDLKTAAVAVIGAMAAFWGLRIIGTKLGLWGGR